MTAVVLAVAILLAVVVYVRVGLRLAIAAYERRLSREIERYRARYRLLSERDGGVDYRFCESMADRELIWLQALAWPVVETANRVRRWTDHQLRDPRDLDPTYLRQHIAELERELGIGEQR